MKHFLTSAAVLLLFILAAGSPAVGAQSAEQQTLEASFDDLKKDLENLSNSALDLLADREKEFHKQLKEHKRDLNARMEDLEAKLEKLSGKSKESVHKSIETLKKKKLQGKDKMERILTKHR